MRRRIVCLANSYKHGGRCVAGICVDTGEWIRLRGPADDGALTLRECSLGVHGELRLLDVFEAELHFAMPSECHPEDFVIAKVPWRLIERPCSPARWQKVIEHADGGASLLSGYKDRVPADDLMRKPMKASLALILPGDLWWWIKEEHGKRRYRAIFHRNHVSFNLAVTDPCCLSQLELLPTGIYSNAMLAPRAKNTWLTVSLSEAFEARAGVGAWHYRLVAGVLAI